MKLRPFVYEQAAVRTVFGSGRLDDLAREAELLGLKRVLVLSTPGQKRLGEAAVLRLGNRAAGLHAKAQMHVPIETAEAGRAEAKHLDADGLVAIGGGSTVGLAKAIALTSALPIIAVPTTYAGSEMSAIWGLTEGGAKRTGRDNKVRPRTVIYDPSLSYGLPVEISSTSGMNAIAHCVEGLYAQDTNPVVQLLAAEGIRALAHALPRIAQNSTNPEARAEALYGAWLAGIVLDRTTMGLHHKLCHTLGGSFNLPHAEVHTVILPQATAYNRAAAPEAMHVIAQALGVDDAAEGLYDLAANLHAPVALRDIGMKEEGLERAAILATENPYYNPRPVELAGLRELLANAYRGKRPSIA